MADTAGSETGSVGAGQPSVAAPLGKSTTPEDLLAMYDEEIQTKEEDISKEVDKQAEVADRLPKKIASNTLAKKINEKAGQTASSDTNLQEDSQESTKSEDGSEDTEGEATGAPKSLKAKFGDAELDIPEEAEVLLPINGKDVPVKVGEARKAFTKIEARARELDQGFSRIDKREKSLQSEYTTIQDKFKTISELASKGDHIAAIRFLAEMSGKDPIEYEKQVMQSLDQMSNVFNKMNQEQRDLFFAKRKNEYLEKKFNESSEKAKWHEQKSELEVKVDTLSSEHGLTKSKFFDLYKDLVESKAFESPEAIQPEDVIAYHKNLQHVEKVDLAIKSVNPKLAQDPEIFDEIIKLTISHPEYTKEDIAKIVKDALGSNLVTSSVENLNRKVQKANSTGHRAQSTKVSSKKEGDENAVDAELDDYFFGKRPVIVR